MPQSHDRITRVNEILKREIADFIEKRGFNEGGRLVSVTKVRTSETLRHATVYISMIGAGSKDSESIKSAIRDLMSLKNEIQSGIAKHIPMKYTPVLRFVYDPNIEEGDRVLSLLNKLEKND